MMELAPAASASTSSSSDSLSHPTDSAKIDRSGSAAGALSNRSDAELLRN